jgi:isoleucyl-tRNA synthetase
VKKVTEDLEAMKVHQATRALEDFWLNDLSRGYIQFVRDRLSRDDEEVKTVLRVVYLGLLKLCAPTIPFITEKLWQELKDKKIVKEESIHLCDWPKPDKKKISEKLEKEFENAMRVIEKGLAERDKEKIGLRWPLARADVACSFVLERDVKEIIARQLNVKKVETKKKEGPEMVVKLDTKLTNDLEAAGFARELPRQLQAERKKAGLKKGDLISLEISVEERLEKMLKKWVEFLKERTNSKEIKFTEKLGDRAIEFSIKSEKVRISFH